MPMQSLPLLSAPAAHVLDAVGSASSAEEAFRRIDLLRHAVAGPGVFSLNLNVTTADNGRNEVVLRRLYSSAPGEWPVAGTKRKRRTAWTEALFLRGEVFVGEGTEAVASNFDDHDRMQAHGLRSFINVPLLRDGLCYATLNAFAQAERWEPRQVDSMRLLAQAAAPWIRPIEDLSYAFD